ncbi:MAG: hypothetical protein K0B06_05130 [Brevefilum sp.]|nr:hypothetical protein [Brevefilum sp.]
MEANTCPYLGLINDPNTSTTFPDAANACHQAKPPALVKLDYQSSTCLQDEHQECPGYIHAWPDGFPKSLLRPKPIFTLVPIERLSWILVAIPVMLFLWAGFTGRLSFLSLDFRPKTANTPTSLPFFTRTPTETLTFTLTLTATETPLPQTETATPTHTPTRTPTVTRSPTSTVDQSFWILPTNTPVSSDPTSRPPAPTQPPTSAPPTEPPPPTSTRPPDVRPSNTPSPRP